VCVCVCTGAASDTAAGATTGLPQVLAGLAGDAAARSGTAPAGFEAEAAVELF
jgi:hypothetical protein